MPAIRSDRHFASAIAAGADLLVIGRPVTAAADPDAALDAILEAIAAAT
jgi:orotidine-5'-phosphate decarboxylase